MSRKAALITGGAKRVGVVLALHFAKAGYDIALHYNRSEKEAREVQKQVLSLGVQCEIFAQDLTDIAALPALIANVQKTFPHCRTLINNASVFERSEFLQTEAALFDRQFDANFKAPFFLTQAFAKAFGEGSVVNMLDTEITGTGGSHFAYLLSKKTFADFTHMAARALAPKIRVNAVAPGVMIASDAEEAGYMEQLQQKVPLKRLALPEDAAAIALWLSENTALTGQVIYVDGGKHVL